MKHGIKKISTGIAALIIAATGALGAVDPASAASSPKFISWTAAQVNDLPTTPVTTNIDGVPVTVRLTTTGDVTGAVFGSSSTTYTVDGITETATAFRLNSLSGDARITTELTLDPGKLRDFDMLVSDAEGTAFKVYAIDKNGNRVSVTNWSVSSQELDGTTPADNPNPYYKGATEVSFDGPNGNGVAGDTQNNDTMRVHINIDEANLANIHKIYFETGTPGINDFVLLTYRGTRLTHAPVVKDDTFAGESCKEKTVSILANDTDADGDKLTVTHIDGQPAVVGTPIKLKDGTATVTLQPDGTVRIEPTSCHVGKVSFVYTVTDGDESAAARVSGEFRAKAAPKTPNTGLKLITSNPIIVIAAGLIAVVAAVAVARRARQ